MMNRAQRRKQAKDDKRARKPMYPGGFVEVPAALSSTLADGEKFTIAGLQRMNDGRITTQCTPGSETVWTAKSPPDDE